MEPHGFLGVPVGFPIGLKKWLYVGGWHFANQTTSSAPTSCFQDKPKYILKLPVNGHE